jgi:CRP-like cAMP-binding protein
MDNKALKHGEWDLISGCALFEGTAEAFIMKVLGDDRSRLLVLEKGDIVFDVYDYRRTLGLVLSGSIAVTKPPSTRYAMNTLWPGDLFGAADLYDEDAAVVTVLTAQSPCRVVFFSRDLLETLVFGEKAAALNYIRFLTGRVRFLNEKIRGLVSDSAEEALKHYLAGNADSGRIVHLDGSMSKLADTLNIGRASLYRAFDALENSGSIRKNGREVHIIKLDETSEIEREML